MVGQAMDNNPDEKLKEFYKGLNIEELLKKIALSHKYQQAVMFNCYHRRQPVEKYINSLVSSQTNVLILVELIIEKAKGESTYYG